MALKNKPVTIKVDRNFFCELEKFRFREAQRINMPRFSQIEASALLAKGGLFDKKFSFKDERKKR